MTKEEWYKLGYITAYFLGAVVTLLYIGLK